MGTMIGLISTDMSSPTAAYETARKLVKTAVKLEQIEKETKGAAIESLTRKGKFGSWLLKLHKGHNVSVHLHLFVRLVEIVEDLAVKTGNEADHIENMILEIKGVRDAGKRGAADCCPEVFMSQSVSDCDRKTGIENTQCH